MVLLYREKKEKESLYFPRLTAVCIRVVYISKWLTKAADIGRIVIIFYMVWCFVNAYFTTYLMSYFMGPRVILNIDSIGICCPHLAVLVLVDLKHKAFENGWLVKRWPRIKIMTFLYQIMLISLQNQLASRCGALGFSPSQLASAESILRAMDYENRK